MVTRGPSVAATRKGERWSMLFCHDQLQYGRRLRELTVIDQNTREALATEARGSFSAHDVFDTLNRLSRSHRKPVVIQVDNGTEFASRALNALSYPEDVRPDFSRPGEADGQRAHRVVQYQAVRGVPERARLRIARRRRGSLDFVADRLQYSASTRRPQHPEC